MVIHKKIYMEFFGYTEADTILCTVCGRVAVDIHHIHPKKMGGHKTFEFNGKTYEIESIKNYIALDRECHDAAHADKLSKGVLWIAQQTKIIRHG